jgi:hypothetical protein
LGNGHQRHDNYDEYLALARHARPRTLRRPRIIDDGQPGPTRLKLVVDENPATILFRLEETGFRIARTLP